MKLANEIQMNSMINTCLPCSSRAQLKFSNVFSCNFVMNFKWLSIECDIKITNVILTNQFVKRQRAKKERKQHKNSVEFVKRM